MMLIKSSLGFLLTIYALFTNEAEDKRKGVQCDGYHEEYFLLWLKRNWKMHHASRFEKKITWFFKEINEGENAKPACLYYHWKKPSEHTGSKLWCTVVPDSIIKLGESSKIIASF